MASSTDSDSSFNVETDEFDELMIDLRNIDEVDGEMNDSDNSETSEDSDHRRQRHRVNRNRLCPFYVNRNDILILFDDEKLRKTFRFDRDSINCIKDIFVVARYMLLLMLNSLS